MYRPAWDIVVWLLSILGTIVSLSGVVVGWRYLRRRPAVLPGTTRTVAPACIAK